MSAKSSLVGWTKRGSVSGLKQPEPSSFWATFRAPRNARQIERLCLIAILAITAILYSWNLDKNGWANPYYSAAAQAGATDWKAWFFGSADLGNLITIDKTPLSVWVMGLSVRVFGLSSWSILLPQVLMGIATSWLIYRIIRTGQGAGAALFGTILYSSIPVVALMSRFNNPEPLMGLLVVAAAYFIVKATAEDRFHWYLLAGAALGFAFMAKQAQGLLILPAIVAVVLLTGSGPLRRKITGLAGATAAMVATGGWWILVVELWPANDRPYVGGSSGNSVLQLTTSYNGVQRFSRFTNQDGVTAPAEPQSILEVLRAGLGRLFNADFAQEAAWFIFPALACAVLLVVLKDPTNRSKPSPAALLGAIWLFTVFGVLTFAGTMVHTYYTYSLAAPMALVIPMGFTLLATARARPVSRLIGSVVILASAYLASRIMEYSDGWPPGLQFAIVAVGVLASVVWWMPSVKRRSVVLLPVVVSLLIGPVVTNLHSVNTPQGGTNPLSGPPSMIEGSLSKKFEAARGGRDLRTLHLAFGAPPDPDLVQLLRMDSGPRWAAVTVTAQNAALYQLESRRPVAALGGWLGLDPAPTLEEFKALAAQGRIGLFIDQPELLNDQSVGEETGKVIQWIRDNFTPQNVGGQSVYDLRRQPTP